MKPDMVRQGFEHTGYPYSLYVVLTVVMVLCTLIYAIPQTAIFGAILLTAYLEGQLPLTLGSESLSIFRLWSAYWHGLEFICAMRGCGHWCRFEDRLSTALVETTTSRVALRAAV